MELQGADEGLHFGSFEPKEIFPNLGLWRLAWYRRQSTVMFSLWHVSMVCLGSQFSEEGQVPGSMPKLNSHFIRHPHVVVISIHSTLQGLGKTRLDGVRFLFSVLHSNDRLPHPDFSTLVNMFSNVELSQLIVL